MCVKSRGELTLQVKTVEQPEHEQTQQVRGGEARAHYERDHESKGQPSKAILEEPHSLMGNAKATLPNTINRIQNCSRVC